jgi:hypothetical protein
MRNACLIEKTRQCARMPSENMEGGGGVIVFSPTNSIGMGDTQFSG